MTVLVERRCTMLAYSQSFVVIAVELVLLCVELHV